MNSLENPKLGAGEPDNGQMNLALAWDVLKELGNSERHFNNLEAEYRKLASIWLLAGFAGMGFILKENPQIAVPREIALMAIGLATSVGIFLLWIVDLLVYHQLLDACFTQAKTIEKKYPKELPQVRSSMEHTQGGGKVVTTRVRWFYILLTAAPVVFSAPLFVLWWQKEHGTIAAIAAAVISAAYIGGASRIIWTNVPGLKKARAGAD